MESKQLRHRETHVMVLPFPIQGHINPMLQFSKRLASKGLRVTLIMTSKSMKPSATSVNFECIEFPEGDTSNNLNGYMEIYDALFPDRLAKFIEKNQACSDHPAKVIVYDSMVPWALNVAKRFGLQGASFFTQAWAVNSIFYHFHQGTFRVPLEDPVVSLPSLPKLTINDLPSFVRDNSGPYPEITKFVRRQFMNIQEADWIFCNTYDELEHEIINWVASKWPVKNIGPTIPSMYLDKRVKDDNDYGLSLFKPDRDLSLKWLDSKETGSVVYVSFGSLAGLTVEQMLELAVGLKRSNRCFLWVVREAEQHKLPSNFVEETSEKGLVVSWSPQLDVLAHRAVGCFITHCGWNSTLEALSLGIPMIAMPQWTDQPANAKLVADVWQVGIRVSKDDKGVIRKEEIERCIREIMEGERSMDFKTNSEKWKKLARDAVDEGGSSDKNIDEFVAKLACNLSSHYVNGCTTREFLACYKN